MEWTQERVEQLTNLWLEGLSASQIAVQMGGGISRNAVIGKVHRLKLSGRARAVKSASAAVASSKEKGETLVPVATSLSEKREEKVAKQEVKKSEAAASKTKEDDARVVRLNIVEMSREQEKSAPKQEDEAVNDVAEDNVVVVESRSRPDDEVVIPMSRRLTLLQLTEKTCKWPIGDPLQGNFYFCGAEACEGSPYCRYHSKIAFQPVADRRRLRA